MATDALMKASDRPVGNRPAKIAGRSMASNRPSVEPRICRKLSKPVVSAAKDGFVLVPRRRLSVVTAWTPGRSRMARSMAVETNDGLMTRSLTRLRLRKRG